MNTINPDFLNPSASRLHQGARPKYLFKRGGVFYFKRKIPADVAHGFPAYTEQVWKSLGTTLLHRAKVYLAVEVTEPLPRDRGATSKPQRAQHTLPVQPQGR